MQIVNGYMKKQISHKQLKAVYYIRESTEEQDKGFSPENQERVIREYAKREGLNIVDQYKDLISGTSTKKRSDFLRMMDDAQKKKFGVILVYHTSRFARNVSDARKNKENLREKLDIDVISVTQPFGDWRKPSAFLNEGINELFDAYYSKQLSFWVKDALQEKRRQGKPVGNPPFGYYKKRLGFDATKDRPIYEDEWRVHKEEVKIVKSIFNLYSTGQKSFADIAFEINRLGIKTKNGNPFGYGSIKDILKNKTYIGLIYSPRRGYPELKGAHKPIVSKVVFDKVQEKIEERRNTNGRPVAQHRFYLLQGLLYCNKCRKHFDKNKTDNPNTKMLPKMYCERSGRKIGEVLNYGCKIRREYKDCKQPSVSCDIIDKQVLDFMEGLKLPDDIIEKVLKNLEVSLKEYLGSSDLQKEVNQLEGRRKRLNTMYEMGELDDDKYRRDVGEIQRKIKQFEKQGITAKNKDKLVKDRLRQTEKFLKNFGKFWRINSTPEDQREGILMVIKRIWVNGKKVVAIEPHDEFKDLFLTQQKVLGQPPLATPE